MVVAISFSKRCAFVQPHWEFSDRVLEIYTINSRGGDKVQLTHNDVDEEWPTYSPSGKRIAYAPIEGAGGIYSIMTGGGDKILVAHNGGVPFLARRQEDRLRVLRQ